MLAGLILTSISTLTARAALFQRKSRSGWLEELDGIREDSLVSPDGAVDQVVDAGDIWTDLREGGVYADPHEIASLYATDETPDLPPARPKAAKPTKARAKRGRPEGADAPAAAVVDAPLPPAEAPAAILPPPPAPPAAAPVLPPPPAAPAVDATVDEVPMAEAVGPHESEPMWVQPAPHPIRPSEMWHPADLAPSSLGDEVPPMVEERIASHDLAEPAPSTPDEQPYAEVASADPTYADPSYADPTYADPTYVEAYAEPMADDAEVVFAGPSVPAVDLHAEQIIDHDRASELESELAAAADLTVMHDASLHPIDTPSAGGLVPGPVGRRVRRDRPALPQEHVAIDLPMADPMPVAEVPAISPSRGDRSPLPEPSLPPAALPTRAPVDAAPIPSVAEVEHPVAAEVAPAPVVEDPAAVEVVEVAAPPAAEAPIAPVSLEPGPDGLLAVPGTIVRLGGSALGSAALDADGAHLALAAGWIWVSPGDGSPAPVHVELPTSLATVTAGSTALLVVEDGDATFAFVADGTVELRRPDGIATLTRGAIAMLDASGTANVDHASDEELAADPIVAENLALDAEL